MKKALCAVSTSLQLDLLPAIPVLSLVAEIVQLSRAFSCKDCTALPSLVAKIVQRSRR